MGTVTTIKRLIGKPDYDGRAYLFIGEDDDGFAWATNRSWVAAAQGRRVLVAGAGGSADDVVRDMIEVGPECARAGMGAVARLAGGRGRSVRPGVSAGAVR